MYSKDLFVCPGKFVGFRTPGYGTGQLRCTAPGSSCSFIDYNIRLFNFEDAGHGGILRYHLWWCCSGCFLLSLLMLPVPFRQLKAIAAQADWSWWMRIPLWVVPILFSVVQSKIVHYSSLTYFPVSFLAALSVQELLQKKLKLRSEQGRMVLPR